MFERYGAFVARRARLVLVIAGVLVAISAVVGFGAFGKLLNGGFDDPASDSSKAASVGTTRYGGATNFILLVPPPDGTVDAAQVAGAGADLASRLPAEPGVTNVVSYWGTRAPALRSTDGTQG